MHALSCLDYMNVIKKLESVKISDPSDAILCFGAKGRDVSGVHEADPDPSTPRLCYSIYLMDGVRQIH
ncbi:hypothetical protein Pyn_39494 [Prunus yedoensis var. nudiflora]|uniref:Uncharacterized protein n=1 Tax=Prunus yedoensis var. nudiflora TaxID=2094558 RepID=A0A314UFF7_PRUYE|nr:hypothetical protein Pyn_39494 [Prunus yedoensis var. nudiflora]